MAQRLSDWLADRGYKPDSGSCKAGSESDGLGSDVFRRFAASLDRAGAASGSNVGNLSGQSGIRGTSDTRLSVSDTTPGESKEKGASTSTRAVSNDEDIGLAPLEEELEPRQAEIPKEPVADTTVPAATASDTLPEETKKLLPLKSLIEEQLEAGRLGNAKEKLMRRKPEDIQPLYPPGYVRPRTGISPWLYVGFGLAGCLVVALFFWLLSL